MREIKAFYLIYKQLTLPFGLVLVCIICLDLILFIWDLIGLEMTFDIFMTCILCFVPSLLLEMLLEWIVKESEKNDQNK